MPLHITPGLARTIQRQKNDKAKCSCSNSNCMYQLPTYPGAYPTACPMCGSKIEKCKSHKEDLEMKADELIEKVLNGEDPKSSLEEAKIPVTNLSNKQAAFARAWNEITQNIMLPRPKMDPKLNDLAANVLDAMKKLEKHINAKWSGKK